MAVSKNMQMVDGGLLGSGPKQIVIGIDQSYSGFGLSMLATKGMPLHAEWLYKGSGTGVDRLLDISDWLSRMLNITTVEGFEITAVAMEGYAPGAKFGREVAGELGAVVKIALAVHLPFSPVHVVAPMRLKKYVTGKGTGVGKNQMLLHVYKKWGVEFHDDNLADAYSLAHLVSGRASTAYEREVYSQVVAAVT